MSTYTVYPIRCGTLDLPKSGLTYLLDEGQTVRSPVVVLLLLPDDPDDDWVGVVDAGAAEGELAGRNIPDGGADPIREGLAEQGVEPGDIDHLILTHLHHDHAANVELFSDAEVLIQQAELAAARDPLPYMERVYIDDQLAAVERADTTVVEGGYRLREGIELRLTPGHTEGMQSVVVDTAGGPHALVCDLVYCRQNLDPSLTEIRDVDGRTIEIEPADYDADYVPPGLHVDVQACYDSFERMRERVGTGGTVVAGHDPAVLGEPFPR